MQEEGFWQSGVESRICKKEVCEMPEILAKWGRKAVDFCLNLLLLIGRNFVSHGFLQK